MIVRIPTPRDFTLISVLQTLCGGRWLLGWVGSIGVKRTHSALVYRSEEELFEVCVCLASATKFIVICVSNRRRKVQEMGQQDTWVKMGLSRLNRDS